MALAIRKDLINARSRSDLCSNHLAGLLTNLLLVCRVLQLAIPSIAGTSFRTWAAVKTRAKGLAFGSFEVGFDVVVKRYTLGNVLRNIIWSDLHSNTCLWSKFHRALSRPRSWPKWFLGQASWYRYCRVIGECPSSGKGDTWHCCCLKSRVGSNIGCLIISLDQTVFRRNYNRRTF